jgi:hypothetical protein
MVQHITYNNENEKENEAAMSPNGHVLIFAEL